MIRYAICLLVILAFVSCKDQPARPGAILDENYNPIDPATVPTTTATTTPETAEPPQNAQGVWHYTCPTGCTGGGGSATPCATCGKTLVHNSAYHNNGAAGTPTAAPAAGAPIAGNPGSITNPIVQGVPGATGVPVAPATTTPKVAEPPQNAQGVWHYTCPNGCTGGAGSAVACASCGTTLAHNQGYH